MPPADVELTYHGPQVRVVELDRDVVDGDVVKVSPELASRLLCAVGFDGPDGLKPPPPPEPDGTHGAQNAHPEGLYPDDEGFADGGDQPVAAPDPPKRGKGEADDDGDED